jgi:hypothetical protein
MLLCGLLTPTMLLLFGVGYASAPAVAICPDLLTAASAQKPAVKVSLTGKRLELELLSRHPPIFQIRYEVLDAH